jgi:hypothetical protein
MLSQFATPVLSLSLLDRAIFASVSAMSVFALFSPLLSLGR